MRWPTTAEHRALADAVAGLAASVTPFAERRRVIETDAGWSADLWDRLARELQVTGIVIAAAAGGSDGGVEAAAVVAHELGAALSTEPFCDAAVGGGWILERSRARVAAAKNAAEALAQGSQIVVPVGADEAGAATIVAAPSAGAIRLSGSLGVVAGGGAATSLLIAAASSVGGQVESVWLVPRSAIDGLTLHRGIDGSPLLHGEIDVVVEDTAEILSGANAARVWREAMRMTSVCRCAFALGVMGTAVADTFDYIAAREQFGQPIGSFQSVAHRAVDMAIAVEIATAALADALSHEVSDPTADRTLRILVADAARAVAQGAVQLHGGAGMAIETRVAHCFRLLTAHEAIAGSPDLHRELLATAIGLTPIKHPAGRRGSASVLSNVAAGTGEAHDLAEFRHEVRRFLESELTESLRYAGTAMTSVYTTHEASVHWQQVLHRRGWGAPAWPVEYGGCGWDVERRYIFWEECLRAGAPPTPLGIQMCGPAIIEFGSDEQRAEFLPKMLTGEHFWCQGYSEPDAGSDLASLRCAAVRDGGDLVINGTKVWSTHAQTSNWMFALVRTGTFDRPQRGITFVLIDMTSPGVTVTPMVSLSGEHIQNEISFVDVRVPIANVVGDVDDGWTVAKYLLEFERGGAAYAPEITVMLERLLNEALAPNRSLPASFGLKVADAIARVRSLRAFERASMSSSKSPGVDSSIMKIVGTELRQAVTELALEVAGPLAAYYQPDHLVAGGPAVLPRSRAAERVGTLEDARAPLRYLNDRAGSIYAGSNEIQRNILAKAMPTRIR